MKITLVGMGSGAPGSLTAAGLETLRGAELIIVAQGHLHACTLETVTDGYLLFQQRLNLAAGPLQSCPLVDFNYLFQSRETFLGVLILTILLQLTDKHIIIGLALAAGVKILLHGPIHEGGIIRIAHTEIARICHGLV